MKAKNEEIIIEAGELKREEVIKGESGVNGHGKYDENGKLIINPKIVETVEDLKPEKKPEKKEEPKPEFLVKDYIKQQSNEDTVLVYGIFNSKGIGVWQESNQLSAKKNDDLKKTIEAIKKTIEDKLSRNPERFLNNTDLRMAIGSAVPNVYNGYPRGTFNGKDEFNRIGKWALAIPDTLDHVHPSDLRKVNVGIEAKLCWNNGEKIVKSTFEDDIAVKDRYSKKTALFVVNVMKD